MSNRHLFTLAEALALLPTVRQMVIELQTRRQELDEATTEVRRLENLTGGNGHLAADIERARHEAQVRSEKLERLVEELIGLGVELKGIEQGLVDFPSEHEGRVALLCWQLGEDTIGWWHEEDAGFAGRQKLYPIEW